jgi:hypothetical protein
MVKYFFRVVMCVILAHFMGRIDVEREYGWLGGLWHGICSIPNYIIGYLFDPIPVKAVLYTGGYNVCWWIMFIFSACMYIVAFVYDIRHSI